MADRTRRLFFALWPKDELRREIEHETRFAARHSGGRVIASSNFHFTLAFLGSVPESRLAALFRCRDSVAIEPFELILGVLKRWPRQELLCLEPISGQDRLADVADRLRAALRAESFEIERRPFRAHLTLARDVRREHEFKPIKPIHCLVERMELVESQVTDRGSTYTVLQE